MALNFCNNNSLSAITALPATISGGGLNLISTQTASSSSSLSFTSGIDSTYKEYIFKMYNLHPSTHAAEVQFNLSVDSGSNYNVTKTSSYFHAEHNESGSTSDFTYLSSRDLAQGTGYQTLHQGTGTDNDQGISGFLHLFDPSNTTFVKHFLSQVSSYKDDDFNQNTFVGGYGNTTSAVDAVDFKMSSGNIDSGVIKLYGVS